MYLLGIRPIAQGNEVFTMSANSVLGHVNVIMGHSHIRAKCIFCYYLRFSIVLCKLQSERESVWTTIWKGFHVNCNLEGVSWSYAEERLSGGAIRHSCNTDCPDLCESAFWNPLFQGPQPHVACLRDFRTERGAKFNDWILVWPERYEVSTTDFSVVWVRVVSIQRKQHWSNHHGS